MFTLTDLAEIKTEIFGDRQELYSVEKNAVSFGLSLLSNLDRGTACEKYLCRTMNAHGIDATHMGGSGNSNDISLYVGGRIVRGESKSSLLGPQSGKYYFIGVKPELFDILFFCFVHPSRGVVVKTASAKSIRQWVAEYNPTNKTKDGGPASYDIYFRGDMTNTKIPTIEWDPAGEGVKM